VQNNKLSVDEITFLAWLIHCLVGLYKDGQRFCHDYNCSRLLESIPAGSLYGERVTWFRQRCRYLQLHNVAQLLI